MRFMAIVAVVLLGVALFAGCAKKGAGPTLRYPPTPGGTVGPSPEMIQKGIPPSVPSASTAPSAVPAATGPAAVGGAPAAATAPAVTPPAPGKGAPAKPGG